MSRPTVAELVIAIRAEAEFLDAAQCAPMGSEVEQLALHHARYATEQVKKLEKELTSYIETLVTAVTALRVDKRRK